jgi:hypothetical protein
MAHEIDLCFMGGRGMVRVHTLAVIWITVKIDVGERRDYEWAGCRADSAAIESSVQSAQKLPTTSSSWVKESAT